jgi:hypothetical protein
MAASSDARVSGTAAGLHEFIQKAEPISERSAILRCTTGVYHDQFSSRLDNLDAKVERAETMNSNVQTLLGAVRFLI